MTRDQFRRAMERFKKDRAYTCVTVNEQGHSFFSDVDGVFFLVGFNENILIRDGKITVFYTGTIARETSKSRIRYINAMYLEEVKT
ncbi:MAG: hypothetical protein IJH37_05100 [Clostridia bacterium]|nr:hypothetical protein [Clostridia bacterium]